MADSRQRAKAPKCERTHRASIGHQPDASVVNLYDEEHGREVVACTWLLCDRCAEYVKGLTYYSSHSYDRYEPLILAHVGDSIWTALECAFAFLAGQYEPMTLAEQYAYNDSIPAMLAADGYVTQLEPHGPSEAMWPRRAA